MIRHNNYENKDLRQILETFPHYQQVNFALYCSKEIESNDSTVIDFNLAVERWLKGDRTVDLQLARNNAAVAAADTHYIVFPVYYSVYISSNAAYYANNVAWYTALAKSLALYSNDETQRLIVFDQFHNEYYQIAQNWLSHWEIRNFPKDEPDFPIFDFLQDYNLISYLLPKKEDYYYLNLNGFDIKHVNEAELLKLINTTHIKQILRRIINNAET